MSAYRSSFGIGAVALALAATLAACGGGGGGTSGGVGGGGGIPSGPVPTSTPVSTQQIVTMALPTTAMGQRTDPTFGVIGGYTQQQFSQTLAFAPGSQIMIANGQAGTPHTFGVVSTTGFDSGAALNTSATGGNTIQAGFNTGSVNGDTTVGPFTLAAGLYYIGCAFHYQSNQMRTVLNVAASATPGPQATQPPGQPTPPPPGGYGY